MQTIYSQHGEDIAIKRYFKNYRDGFYVDVGAFHPIKYSNTQMFYKMGWCGLNIEPNPENIKIFEKERKRDININCGVAKTSSNMNYYKFNHGAVNTFVQDHAESWNKKEGFQIEKILSVPTIPLGEILHTHSNEFSQIDFMSIDVEGMDLEVLKSNDWENFKPKMLIVEENFYAYEHYKDSPIIQFLLNKGYYLWNINAISLFFILKDQ